MFRFESFPEAMHFTATNLERLMKSARRSRLFVWSAMMLILWSLCGTNAQAYSAVGVSPSSQSFGSVSVNALSAPQWFTIMNMGSQKITIVSVVSSSSQFGATGPSLPLTVYPGQGAAFQVVFQPLTVGTFSGTITVSLDRYSSGAKSVSVSGTGLATVNSAATLQSIAVTPSNPSISPSKTQQFTATGTYSDGSTKNITTTVTWASSNNAVATIGTSTGLATGMTAGTSQITATLGGVVSPNDALTVTATTGNFYTTNFPLTENPISESGKWINGGVAGWLNVRTTPGHVFGIGMSSGCPDN